MYGRSVAERAAIDIYVRAVEMNLNAERVADTAGVAYDMAASNLAKTRAAEADAAAQAVAVGVSKEDLLTVYKNAKATI